MIALKAFARSYRLIAMCARSVCYAVHAEDGGGNEVGITR